MKLSNFAKLSLSKDLRHEVIIGVAGIVSVVGICVILRDHNESKEGFRMRDIVAKAQNTVRTGVTLVTNIATGARQTIYGKSKSLLPF